MAASWKATRRGTGGHRDGSATKFFRSSAADKTSQGTGGTKKLVTALCFKVLSV